MGEAACWLGGLQGQDAGLSPLCQGQGRRSVLLKWPHPPGVGRPLTPGCFLSVKPGEGPCPVSRAVIPTSPALPTGASDRPHRSRAESGQFPRPALLKAGASRILTQENGSGWGSEPSPHPPCDLAPVSKQPCNSCWFVIWAHAVFKDFGFQLADITLHLNSRIITHHQSFFSACF